jgi:threonine/homoserine/homoserine lactone efflux protein
MIDFLLKGFILGLSIAAPVGQIGVLCIRRTLTSGRLAGFVSGLGAATADACYGAVAAFGLSAVSGFLVAQSIWLRLLGGIFLIYLGVKIFLERPASEASALPARGLAGAYATTFLLTLANPTTILSFVAVFAGLGLVASGVEYTDSLGMVLGVFLGSATWWLILSTGVEFLRRRLPEGWMAWINRISGAIIGTFGVLALASALL